jgi:hypothetical protein
MQFGTQVNSAQQADYSIQLSLSGLPPGTTGTIDPQTICPGQSTTVTITASSTAPESQNVSVTLKGTPSASVSSASISFLVDVTPKPGSLPDNRTDYVSTEDTPYAAVYDPLHHLVFASSESWNRVDVISSVTHAIVTEVPVRDPRGIDITQDDSTVWVASGSRQVFAINASTLAITPYLLPAGSIGYWEGSQLLALADGTLMIILTPGWGYGTSGIAIWNPASNTIEFPNPPGNVSAYAFLRSGNGKLVYVIDSSSAGMAFYYDVLGQTFSKPVTLGGYALSAAVNVDGSRVVVCDANGPNMYNGNFVLMGPLPACGSWGPPFFFGGSIFTPDNQYLYQEGLFSIPLIIKINPNDGSIYSVAPAMPMIPVNVELSPAYYVPIPFSVDETGMILGLQDWGIAFDDSAFTQTYSSNQPGTPTFLQHVSPYFGPLSGGTNSGGFGNVFGITPDVWYGGNHGTASLGSSGTLTITSPPTTTPGPVNIKMLFPDGVEVFDPFFFSYGPYLQYALESGSPPQGNVSAQVVGYGMPGDNVTGTLKVGGSAAAVGPPGYYGLPFAPTPFPNKVLSYTVPPGTPGRADINLTTPDGSSTLPKAMFYAQSVTDYASSDTFTAVLYDQTRQQLYLSAGDHIDVFSLTSKQFETPLNPPAQGKSKQFAGLALTPDASLLLATDLLDGSLAVIDPDNPSTSYVIPIAAVGNRNGCSIGPLYVAPIINNQAMVVTGQIPGIACGPGGTLYLANLTSHTAGPVPSSNSCRITSPGFPVGYVAANSDGQEVAIGGSGGGYNGFCIYDAVANTYYASSYPFSGAAFSSDGNVAAGDFVFTDSSADVVGRVAQPDIYYAALQNGEQLNLQEPQLNAAGSLYYMAWANFIDLMDVQHGMLRMRFSLSETVSNTAVPMAIDSGGQFIYLVTNKGLTIVDLGEAPLSIGWLNPTAASPGTKVAIRGSGFNSSTSGTVDGQAAPVTVTDENTLTLTVPSVSAGPATVTLTNSDGTSYTAVNLLTIQ